MTLYPGFLIQSRMRNWVQTKSFWLHSWALNRDWCFFGLYLLNEVSSIYGILRYMRDKQASHIFNHTHRWKPCPEKKIPHRCTLTLDVSWKKVLDNIFISPSWAHQTFSFCTCHYSAWWSGSVFLRCLNEVTWKGTAAQKGNVCGKIESEIL